MIMTKEELEKWLTDEDWDSKTNKAKRAFVEDFNLSAEQAVGIINILRDGKDEPNENALCEWYRYYWDTQEYIELMDVKDELTGEIEKLKKDLWDARAKYLNICNGIYHQETLEDVRELIENVLDLDF